MPLPGSGGRAGGRSLAPSAESPAPRRPGHSMAVLAADFPLGFPPPCEPGSDRPTTPQCAGRPQSLWRPTRQLRPAFQRPRLFSEPADGHQGPARGLVPQGIAPPLGSPSLGSPLPAPEGGVSRAVRPPPPLPLTRSESGGRSARASTGEARSWARLWRVLGEAHRRTAGWGRSPSSGQTCRSRRTPLPPRGGGTRLSGHWCRCLGRGGGSQVSGDSRATHPLWASVPDLYSGG